MKNLTFKYNFLNAFRIGNFPWKCIEQFPTNGKMTIHQKMVIVNMDFENIDLAGFSLSLLFGDEQDDFLQEVAQLFGAAFAIIFFVLAFIFFIRPTKTFGFFKKEMSQDTTDSSAVESISALDQS